jgi:hypothetical protein
MQKLQPREFNVLTYPNGAHMTFGASSPRVRFFAFMFIIKYLQIPIVIIFLRMRVVVTSLPKDKVATILASLGGRGQRQGAEP